MSGLYDLLYDATNWPLTWSPNVKVTVQVGTFAGCGAAFAVMARAPQRVAAYAGRYQVTGAHRRPDRVEPVAEPDCLDDPTVEVVAAVTGLSHWRGLGGPDHPELLLLGSGRPRQAITATADRGWQCAT